MTRKAVGGEPERLRVPGIASVPAKASVPGIADITGGGINPPVGRGVSPRRPTYPDPTLVKRFTILQIYIGKNDFWYTLLKTFLRRVFPYVIFKNSKSLREGGGVLGHPSTFRGPTQAAR